MADNKNSFMGGVDAVSRKAGTPFNIAGALEASGIKLDVERLQTATGAVKAKTEANNRAKVVSMAMEKTAVKAA